MLLELMRQVKVLITYFVIVFGGAAVLAPLVHGGIQELSRNNVDWWKIDEIADYLARHPFHRYLNRCLLGLALIGLPPLLKELKLPGWREIGLCAPTRRNMAYLGAAFLAGFSVLTLGAVWAMADGERKLVMDHSGASLLRHLKNATLAAVLVSIVEEILFRGVIFQALRKTNSFIAAALFSSAIYSLLHFFEKPENPRHIDYHSGFVVLGQMMNGLLSWEKLLPAFLNLTVVGLIMALALERTRTLYFSVGMHAAFIFWGKSFGFFTRPTAGAKSSTWGSEQLIDGWFPFFLLAFLLAFLAATLPKDSNSKPLPAPDLLPHDSKKQPAAT
ncbi:MAG: CPBP family intramembrane glutamic endopeptidase [Verrucomicrobiales bacterium]